VKIKNSDLFFFIQQFITRSVRAAHGSYFVTTYKTTKLHDGKERKKEKKRRKERRIYIMQFAMITT